MTLLAFACASICLGSSPQVAQVISYEYRSPRRIATIRPYPANRVDDVHRPGFNGRLWIGESFRGGQQTVWPLGWGDPGPEGYGALDNPWQTVYARVDHQVIPLNPWIRIPDTGLQDFERARNEWLRERGYVGGVRTFVNDAHLSQHIDRERARFGQADGTMDLTHEHSPTAQDSALLSDATTPGDARGKAIAPRATITIPDDAPRFRSRQRVDAGHSLPPVALARVVTPQHVASSSIDAGVPGKSTVRFAVVASPAPKPAASDAASPAPETTLAKADGASTDHPAQAR
ncbi:MAG: hypothetical protein SFZ23_04165 [Planctomycetota bacterium]|nr:hypothetical protein [Planctomycetota bacterium]